MSEVRWVILLLSSLVILYYYPILAGADNIQSIINSASPGETIFIPAGSYSETITIDKPLHIVGEGESFTLLIGGIIVESSNVEIKGLTIQNHSIGIRVVNSTNVTIYDNTFYNLDEGIVIENTSSFITVFRNNFMGNKVNALDDSGNNTSWYKNSKGNYWFNYNGSDDDNNEIGDTPYQIPGRGNSSDRFPLMKPDTLPPIVDFSYKPLVATTQDTIYFMDNSSDPDGFIVSYQWVFGDSNTSNESNPTYRYSDNGLYNVTLTVWDNYNVSSTIIKQVLVLNVPPEARFTYTPSNPTDLDEILFNSTSFDTDGVIVNTSWFLGDGFTTSETSFTHRFQDDGLYNVTLVVFDDDGANSSFSRSIVVENVPPIPSFSCFSSNSVTIYEGSTVRFYDASQDLDGEIVSWRWDFGDGSVSDDRNPTHVFKEKGVYEVTLSIIDDDGAARSFSKRVTVFGEVEDIKLFTGLNTFDIIFIVFIIAMVIMVVVLTRKYGK